MKKPKKPQFKHEGVEKEGKEAFFSLLPLPYRGALANETLLLPQRRICTRCFL
jgi:hypothetical protein